MRRKDREVTDGARINEMIRSCDCCRLGFKDGEGVYILPLNFGFEEKEEGRVFYFHSANEGKKIELIKAQPHVGFELDLKHKLNSGETACSFSYGFQSVIGQGDIDFVNDKEEKLHAFELIMQHYSGKTDWDIPEAALASVAIIRLRVSELACKEHE